MSNYITKKQLNYINKLIGNKYDFSDLTVKQGIDLITFIKECHEYKYLIFKRREIDYNTKEIEAKINNLQYERFKNSDSVCGATSYVPYEYKGAVRVVGCKKWYHCFVSTREFGNDFRSIEVSSVIYYLGDNEYVNRDIDLLFLNKILNKNDLLKKYSDEIKNISAGGIENE